MQVEIFLKTVASAELEKEIEKDLQQEETLEKVAAILNENTK